MRKVHFTGNTPVLEGGWASPSPCAVNLAEAPFLGWQDQGSLSMCDDQICDTNLDIFPSQSETWWHPVTVPGSFGSNGALTAPGVMC